MNEHVATAPPAPADLEQPTVAATEDALWYMDAIVYELHVKAFFDSNNDGIGDG
jgi:maltose alpha-D-glucosyltransferase / alpha-amylase